MRWWAWGKAHDGGFVLERGDPFAPKEAEKDISGCFAV